MRLRSSRQISHSAFTLLELITVIVIIVILALIALPIAGQMRARGEKIKCISNLKSLHSGAAAYLADNDQWPQIPMMTAGDKNFSRNWVKALEKYSTNHETWICPSIQRGNGGEDYTDQTSFRIDYLPMAFDNKPTTPRKWANQPWFIEKGSPHGKGNLIIYTDGRIDEMVNVRKVH